MHTIGFRCILLWGSDDGNAHLSIVLVVCQGHKATEQFSPTPTIGIDCIRCWRNHHTPDVLHLSTFILSSAFSFSQVPYGIPSTPIQRRPPPPRPTLFRSLFPCCFSSNTCCSPCCSPSSPSKNNSNNPTLTRRCWDDWFHTLSYTPTCILMLAVLTAYFATIVVFAGLYLTVNYVGVR